MTTNLKLTTPPPKRAADRRTRLGYDGRDSDTTVCGPPRQGRPAALGPTRFSTRTRLGYDGRRPATARPAGRVGPDVARHECTCDSDDSETRWREREGTAGTSQAETRPANRPTNYHPPPRCRRREGVLDWDRGRARRQRRDAPICNQGVALSRATATRSGARART